LQYRQLQVFKTVGITSTIVPIVPTMTCVSPILHQDAFAGIDHRFYVKIRHLRGADLQICRNADLRLNEQLPIMAAVSPLIAMRNVTHATRQPLRCRPRLYTSRRPCRSPPAHHMPSPNHLFITATSMLTMSPFFRILTEYHDKPRDSPKHQHILIRQRG
jgi:hypothetical protein